MHLRGVATHIISANKLIITYIYIYIYIYQHLKLNKKNENSYQKNNSQKLDHMMYILIY